MRNIFEALGASVKWNQKAQTLIGVQNKKIELTIGKSKTYINGKSVSLAILAKVINGSTMVPLRFIAEALGSKVDWRANI